MRYQKKKLLDNKNAQLSDLEQILGWNKWWCTTIMKPSFCDYSDSYILVKATLAVFGKGADATAIAEDRNSKQVISKSCTESTDCISEISSTKIDNANELDNVMPSYNLIDYSLKYA